MIRPTSLLRSDSDANRQITIPVVGIKKGTIDCGITIIPCCFPQYCHKFATPKIFLFALVLLGICQGSLQAYLASTLPTVKDIFEFPQLLTDWLSVSHDLFLGLFGLVVAHWGFRIQRASWLGGLACLQGAACFLLVIPYLEHIKTASQSGIEISSGSNLCKLGKIYKTENLELVADEIGNGYITLAVLILLQFLIGLGNASFFAHGFSYLDDNVEKSSVPIYLAILVAVRMSSVQFGSFMAWSFLSQERAWWIGFPIIGCLLILTGTLVATFPKNLLNTVMKQAVASILELARGTSTRTLDQAGENESHPELKFFRSFFRVITNKIIVVNTLSSVFMYMAVDNFTKYEAKFMESQYYIPTIGEGFGDSWKSRLFRNIVKSPLITLSILISGLMIAKIKPRTSRLAGWNVFTTLVVAIIFFSNIAIDCEKGKIVGENKNRLMSPYCSRKCNCDFVSAKFQPVCTQDGKQTYYSPCHAGCSQITYINNIKLYSNCSCAIFDPRLAPPLSLATEGACDNEQCSLYWKLFQAFSVFGSALLATGFVGNLLITLRSVIPSDKSMAVGFELCMAGILVHIPGKFIYFTVEGMTCQYISKDGLSCSLQNSKFGDILSILTGCLLLLSALMDCLVMYFTKSLKIFEPEDSRERGMQMLSSPYFYEPSTLNPSRYDNRPDQRQTSNQPHVYRPTSVDLSQADPISSLSSLDQSMSITFSSDHQRIPEQSRPPRPGRKPTSSEEQPLNTDEDDDIVMTRRPMTPRRQDGTPLGNQRAQNDLIQELKRKSTRV